MSSNPSSEFERREFLRTCGCALAALAIAPVIGACEFSDVSATSEDRPTKTMEINVSGLTKDGDALVTTALAPDGKPIIVIRRAGATFTSLSSRCPHSQRTIKAPVGNKMECPGHFSHFDLDGKVLDGIAVPFGNLRSYSNTYDDARKVLLVRV